ncbi:MAG TPA: DUF4157 domain-containing protein [Caldilineaceae bacterium]|nr:DUF4157 domain-containing protein [Caldilineaceae bacterium]
MKKISATAKPENKRPTVKSKKQTEANHPTGHTVDQPTLSTLQNQVGNAAVQRLLAQRSGGDGAFDLDDATTSRINGARGGGQALDSTVQTQMSQSMGTDFSGVRVHTGSESHELNEQLGAKAFTTGQDIFFRDGEYSPGSSGGQELIAHELTHVVQQGSGAVGAGGEAMRVNAPDDQFEQEADSVAKTVTSSAATPSIQREEMPEEEIQAKRIQRQEMPEEEVQTMRLQRQEEEEVQMKEIQRQEEEEPVQMQEMPEEEPEAA